MWILLMMVMFACAVFAAHTPFRGYSHGAEWPSGTLVRSEDGVVVFPNGSMSGFEKGKLNRRVERHALGWIADASYVSSRAALSFVGTWVVPPLPKRVDQQTLYLFTGISPTFQEPDVIAQPVLAYQQNAGEQWTLASWYCCTAGHSTPIAASPGDIINGTMVYQKGEWVITTANLRTGKSTVLRVSTQEVLNEYFVTLETYNIASCADYPDGGSTLFTGLYATDSAGSVPLQWDIDQLDGTCNENAVVVNQTAVAIQYGGSSSSSSSNRRGRKR